MLLSIDIALRLSRDKLYRVYFCGLIKNGIYKGYNISLHETNNLLNNISLN